MIDHNSKIAVLLGGASKERDISLTTGKAVANGLRERGYTNVHEIDPSEMPLFWQQHWDVAFVALHGAGGEDGEIQKVLEEAKIPYTGSRSDASRLSMSKYKSKEVFEKNNIPTLSFVVTHALQDEKLAFKKVSSLKFPVIGKPDVEGSSIGMEIVKDENQWKDAFNKTHSFGEKVIWEPYLEGGVDLTVGILNDKALPVIEIRPKSGIYDYESKYTQGKTDYYCPARIDEKLTKKVQDYAIKAFHVLGCRSWGRVDFIWKDNQVHCLEVNTVPGMTPTSLVPKAAKQESIDFADLVEMILLDAC
ncbi:MAG: D-alanine--D-alanine ligase [Bdellovibrionales bacterium]|nr:D-alanine--D-alanine ligase [Bdellovibrionales bacterium]